jgi:hypothetical protein
MRFIFSKPIAGKTQGKSEKPQLYLVLVKFITHSTTAYTRYALDFYSFLRLKRDGEV